MHEPATTALRRLPTTRYNERRKPPRVPLRLRVDYCLLLPRSGSLTPTRFRRGIAGDISSAGLFLGDTSYLAVGSTVQLLIRLPDIAANPIGCFAKVVRKDLHGRQGYGLRLLRLRPQDRDRLERFVAQLHRKA